MGLLHECLYRRFNCLAETHKFILFFILKGVKITEINTVNRAEDI